VAGGVGDDRCLSGALAVTSNTQTITLATSPGVRQNLVRSMRSGVPGLLGATANPEPRGTPYSLTEPGGST
jgi:hypothetical protein